MFANAFTSTPICTPARQAIITGKKPWSHGMRCYADQIVPETISEAAGWLELPSTLKDLGYYTASVGKNHFGYNATTMEWFKHGFDDLFPYEGDLAEDVDLNDDFVIMDSYGYYFNETCPHCDPLATEPVDDVNGWYGDVYVYNESWHPTAWTGRTAIEWLDWWRTDGEAAEVARHMKPIDRRLSDPGPSGTYNHSVCTHHTKSAARREQAPMLS